MLTFKGLPLFNFEIDMSDSGDGISVMSIVDLPASEKNFIRMSKEAVKLSFNDEKRIVTGVALRADYPIFRNKLNDQPCNPFYMQFTADQIAKAAQKFMKESRTASVNLNHADGNQSDIYLFESYLVSDILKPSQPEFADIENGSWMVSYKVDNDDVWNKIKEGWLNGFSPEIMGVLSPVQPEPESESDELDELDEYFN